MLAVGCVTRIILCCRLFDLLFVFFFLCFLFQAEDGIRDLVRSRGLGDVYKRQVVDHGAANGDYHFSGTLADQVLGQHFHTHDIARTATTVVAIGRRVEVARVRCGATGNDNACLLYTSDAADERSSVDLGGRGIIKKQKKKKQNRT